MKTEWPVLVAFIVGTIIVVSYFLNVPTLQVTAEAFINWAVILSGFALGLGVINLLQVHSKNIATGSS